MSRFLRVLAVFVGLLFVGDAFAATGYVCESYRKYTSCAEGYYMTTSATSTTYNGTPAVGNACRPCSVASGATFCPGGTTAPIYPVTLNPNGGTGGVPTTLYHTATDSNGDGYGDWYKGTTSTDAGTLVTNLTAAIMTSVPTRSSVTSGNTITKYTFRGYYSAATGGTQYISATRVLTTSGKNQATSSGAKTWHALWQSTLTCAKGYYKSGTSCVACPANTYQPTNGSTATSCTACPDGYTYAGTGASSVRSCTVTCEPGKIVGVPGDVCVTNPQSGTFTSTTVHTVAYGDVSPVNFCPDGFTNGIQTVNQCGACMSDAGYAGKAVSPSAVIQYIRLRNLATNTTNAIGLSRIHAYANGEQIPATYSASSGFTAGVVTHVADAALPSITYNTSNGAFAGISNTGLASSTAGGYVTIQLNTTAPVDKIDVFFAGSAFNTAGVIYYALDISADGENWTTIYDGTNATPTDLEAMVPTSHFVKKTFIPYSTSDAPEGYYAKRRIVTLCANDTSLYPTKCAIGSYTSTTGQSSCIACQNGTTTSAAGATSCNATCANAANASTWETATWSSSKITNLCTIATCDDTYVRTGDSPYVCSACACTEGDNVNACSVTGTNDSNQCEYSYTCATGYKTAGTFTGTAATATNTSPACTACTYTVAYNANGGSGTTTSSTHTYDTAKTLTTNAFTRTGYTFAGWNTKDDGTGTSYADKASVTNLTSTCDGTVTLYAQWTAKCNTITLDNTTNGGTGGTTTLYKLTDSTAWYSEPNCSGTPVTTITKPSKTNATYAGHYTNGGSTAYITSAGALSTSWTVNAATTLYARYNCNTNWTGAGTTIAGTCTGTTYTITLNDNNGTGGSGTVKQQYSTKWTNSGGTTISSVTIPTRNGYVFTGYYTATSGGTRHITAAGALPGNTTFTADTTLYAQWSSCSCTNGTGATGCSATVTNNVCNITWSCDSGYFKATKSATASGGYTATCDSCTENAGASYTASDGNRNTVNTCYYTCTKACTQQTCPANATCTHGTSSTSGKTYYGSSCNASASTCSLSFTCNTGYSKNSEGTACEPKEYTITLDKNNAGANDTSTGTTTLYTRYNTNVYIDSARSSAMTTSANGITKPTKVFTVTYNPNDGSVSPTSANATSTFAGYYSTESSNNGSGTQYVGTSYITSDGLTKGKSITANATWYAKWTAGTVTLPTPTRTGYTFNGWYTAASGGTKIGNAGATYTPTANITLYAQWNANTYTVSYDLKGGSFGTNHPTSASFDNTFTVNNPTHTHGTFAGWKITGMDGVTHTYGSQTTTDTSISSTTATSFKNLRSTSGTVTFTAIWTCSAGYQANDSCGANTIELSWNNGGHGTVPTSSASSCTYGSTFTAPAAMTATGYTFSKWSVNNKSFSAGATINCTIADLGVTSGTATITGTWNANSGTKYVVNHYTKNLGASTYTLHSTDNYTGTTGGTLTLANLKTSITGFTYSEGFAGTATQGTTKPSSGAVTSTTILADGTRVIDLYYTRNTYAITVTADRGFSTVAASGWTNTGTASMSKSFEYEASIALASVVTPSRKTGYTGTLYSKTSGSGTLSGTTFTVGAGVATITVAATGISAPTAAITPASTTKVYNYEATTLTAKNNTSYDSNINVYYSFGSSSSSTGSYSYGTASTTATTSVGAASHRGTKYYKVQVYATDGALTSSTVTSDAVSVTLNNKTITFNVNGGTLNGSSSLYAAYATAALYTSSTGTTEGTIPTASKTGYTFKGWYTAASGGNQIYNASGTLTSVAVSGFTSGSKWVATENKTLYAQWTANTYTVSYDLNGGSFGTNHPTSASFDNTFTVNNPTHTHGTFAGWKITGMDGVTHTYGSQTTTDTSISSTTATSFKNLRSTSGTVTFTAIWTCSAGYQANDNCGANTINLSWNNGGHGTVPTSSASSCTYGSTFTAPAAMTATGYTFGKWSVGSKSFSAGATINCTSADLGVTSGTATITGTWNAHQYTVTFKTGDKTMASQTFTYGTAQKLTAVSGMSNIPVSGNGWSFVGWSTAADSVAEYTDTQSVSNLTATSGGSVTLYGVWKRNVTFKYYDGASATSVTTNEREQRYHNTSATAASASGVSTYALATQSTYEWTPVGWVLNSNTSTSPASTATTTTTTVAPAANAAAVYTALYKRTVTVAYNGNSNTSGSTGNTTGTQYYNVGNGSAKDLSLTLANNGFVRTGYTFSKWAIGSTSGKQYAAGASYTFPNAWSSNASATMYAIWTLNSYQITISKNGGLGTLTVNGVTQTGTTDVTFTCSHGDTFTLPAWSSASGTANQLTRTKMVFTGWSVSGTVTCDSAKTISAQWTTPTCTAGTGVASTSLSSVSGNAPVCSRSSECGFYCSATQPGSAGATSLTTTCTKTDPGYYAAAGATTQTKASAGYYAAAGACEQTACGAGKYNDATGSSSSSACKNINAGCYGTSATKACPAVCGTNEYSDAGAASCSSCPTVYKNSGDTPASHAGVASCKVTCAPGTRVESANAACTTPAGDWYSTASHNVAYGSKSTTSQYSTCPTGEITLTADMLDNIFIGSSDGSMHSGSTRVALKYDLPISAGTYTINVPANSGIVLKAGFLWNMDGTYEKSTSNSFTTTADRLFRLSFSKTDSKANVSPADVAAANITISKQYSISGTTAADHDAATDCKIVAPAGTYVAESGQMFQGCAAGTYKGTSATLNYGSTNSCSGCSGRAQYSSMAQTACTDVSSGYYTTGCNTSGNNCTGQSQCTGATYCTSGVQYSCDSNYQANTDAGKSLATQCQTKCDKGMAVLEKNAACATVTGSNYKTGTALVDYGSVSPTASDVTSGWAAGTIYSCPSSYSISGTAVTNHDARTDCTISCSAGTQVATANAACTTPTGSWYAAAHSVSAGSVSGSNVKSCVTGYATPNTTTATDHSGSGYCTIACPAGTQVLTPNATCTTPTGNWYTGPQTIQQGAVSRTTACAIPSKNLFDKNSIVSGYIMDKNGAISENSSYAITPEYIPVTPGSTFKISGMSTSGGYVVCYDANKEYADYWGNNNRTFTVNSNTKYIRIALPISTVNTYQIEVGDTATAYSAYSGYSINSTTASDHDAPNDCTITCTDGQYVASSGAACSAVANGQYKASHSVKQGSTSTPNNCSDLSGVPSGVTGTYTSVSPQANSTNCRFTGNSVTKTGCSTVSANTVSYSGSAWDTGYYTAKAAKGYFVSGTSADPGCTLCPAGEYQASDDFEGSSCPSKVSCGYYSAKGGTSATGTCVSGQSCGQCQAGTFSAAGAGACTDAPAGSFVGTAGACEATKCVIGSYTSTTGQSACIACGSEESVVIETNDEGEEVTVGTWGLTTTGAGQTSCNATCSNATDSENTTAVKGWATSVWNTDNTVSDVCIPASCAKNHFLDGENAQCPRCDSIANGMFPYSSNGTTKGTEACYLRTNEIPGQYVDITEDDEVLILPCPKATFSVGKETQVVHYGTETSSCTSCSGNTYQDEEGQTECKACPAGYTAYYGGDDYDGDGIDGDGRSDIRSCRIICQPGAYIANAGDSECTSVGAGYWAAATARPYVAYGDTSPRNQCPSGLTTIGYGSGADEAGDCGRILHVGDGTMYLRSDRKTTPSLNVKVGNTTFYGNMTNAEDKYISHGVEKSLKVNYNDDEYSVYDDSGESYIGGGSVSLTLDPSVAATSGVPAKFGEGTDLNWSVTMADGTVLSGVGGCDSRAPSDTAMGAIAEVGFEPDGTADAKACWCKMTSPNQTSKWVLATNNANQCETNCSYFCASGFTGVKDKNVTFRTNIYNLSGISTQ